MDCESTLGLCAYHQYRQGGTLSGYSVWVLCCLQIDCQAKNRTATKEKWVSPFLYFPHLHCFLIPTLVQCQETGSSKVRDSEPETITAPCLLVNATPFSPSILKEYLRPFNMFFFFCYVVFLQLFCTTGRHKQCMKEEKKDVCQDEVEWLQDILISILSKLDVIQCRKTEPAIHHDVSGVGSFGQAGSLKADKSPSWALSLSTIWCVSEVSNV